MPELPELHKFSQFINQFTLGKVFSKITKSEVSKGEVVTPPFTPFSIKSESRGKEIVVYLWPIDKAAKTETKPFPILMNMGMTGHFTGVKDTSKLDKHAHLNFHADNGILSFVDPRRFGSWTAGAGFDIKRSPDPVKEYDQFCDHIKNNITKSVFLKPIAVVLLDQAYFNGIGNYLRCEIMHRCGVDPHVKSISAILGNDLSTKIIDCSKNIKKKEEKTIEIEKLLNSAEDFRKNKLLLACRDVCQEAINLKDAEYPSADSKSFNQWLRVYGKGTPMKIQGRTVWVANSSTNKKSDENVKDSADEIKVTKVKKTTKKVTKSTKHKTTETKIEKQVKTETIIPASTENTPSDSAPNDGNTSAKRGRRKVEVEKAQHVTTTKIAKKRKTK